jgi:hypothetical protein
MRRHQKNDLLVANQILGASLYSSVRSDFCNLENGLFLEVKRVPEAVPT